MSDHVCETCGKEYKTRSGLWKHQKKMLHGKFASNDEAIPIEETMSPAGDSDSPTLSENPPPVIQPTIPAEDTSQQWMHFDFGSDEETTDTIPSTFKSVFKPVPMGSGKMSKAQAAALENQNKGILKMGLTTIDVILTKYAQAITLDPDIEVKHSESDKDLVANAQYRWMEEKGFFLTNYLSTGMIAGSLTVWYVGQPIMRVRKKAKKRLFKGRGILARLPLIGRLFKRKQTDSPEIGQSVEEVGLNEHQ